MRLLTAVMLVLVLPLVAEAQDGHPFGAWYNRQFDLGGAVRGSSNSFRFLDDGTIPSSSYRRVEAEQAVLRTRRNRPGRTPGRSLHNRRILAAQRRAARHAMWDRRRAERLAKKQ